MNKLAIILTTVFISLTLSAETTIESSSDMDNDSGIGYESVLEALNALKAKESVVIRVEQGWTLAEDRMENTIWSFPGEEHPAYPSAVKRTFFEKDGAIHLTMNVLCQAKKPECDDLVAEFEALNDRLRESMRQGK